MIRIVVTNESGSPAHWGVEPLWADGVVVEPDDELSIEFDHPTDWLLDVTLHPGYVSVWPSADSGRESNGLHLPSTVKLNGTTIWALKPGG